MDTAERALYRSPASHGVISGAILYLREDFRLSPGAEGLVVGMVSLGPIGRIWK